MVLIQGDKSTMCAKL